MKSIDLKFVDGFVKVVTPYNEEFVIGARNLKGKWKDGAWWFDDTIVDYVRDLMKSIWGTSGEGEYSECSLLIKDFSKESDLRSKLILFGKTIAVAFGRNSKTIIGDDIIFVKGKINTAGSRTNWYVYVKDATFEILNFPVPQTEMPEVKKAIEEGWAVIKMPMKKRNKEEILKDISFHESEINRLKQELEHE